MVFIEPISSLHLFNKLFNRYLVIIILYIYMCILHQMAIEKTYQVLISHQDFVLIIMILVKKKYILMSFQVQRT